MPELELESARQPQTDKGSIDKPFEVNKSSVVVIRENNNCETKNIIISIPETMKSAKENYKEQLRKSQIKEME